MTEERDINVGTNVARYRGSRTQQAVADAMRERGWKWSQATMWSIEKGDRPVRLVEAVDLAVVLQISIEDLLAMPSVARSARDAIDAAEEVLAAHQKAVRAIDTLNEAHEDLRTALDRACAFPEWQPDKAQTDLIEQALGNVAETVADVARIRKDRSVTGNTQRKAIDNLTKAHGTTFTPDTWRAERGVELIESQPPTPEAT